MFRRKKSKDGARRAVVAGLLASIAVVAAYLRQRARKGGGDEASTSSGSNGSSGSSGSSGRTTPTSERHAAEPAEAHREWQCECGQELRVTGEGRHRVFWLPDAGPEDPLLDDTCPNCERKLNLQPG